MTNTIVVDLSFGDAGKGTTVDYLCATRDIKSVVRFNGGPQAAHHVVQPDGRQHIFSQFGSGTFHGVPTLLSRFMAIDPLRMASEALGLVQQGVPDPLDLLNIDHECIVVTPWHKFAQRRGETQGSCGSGFGEAVCDQRFRPELSLKLKDLGRPNLPQMLMSIRDRVFDQYGADESIDLWDVAEAYKMCAARMLAVDGQAYLRRALSEGEVVFEGSQGVLLDEDYGFHPYTTWSSTTPVNAFTLLDEAGCPGDAAKLGVLRSYTTRHGPGPFITEADLDLPDAHNVHNEWQGAFRVGHFDAVAHRYAVECSDGIDGLVVTHLDRSQGMGLFCWSYYDTEERKGVPQLLPKDPGDLVARRLFTESMDRFRPQYANWKDEGQAVTIWLSLHVPVVLESYGPSWQSKKERLDLVRGFDYDAGHLVQIRMKEDAMT